MANFEKIEAAFEEKDMVRFEQEVAKLKDIDTKNEDGWSAFFNLAYYASSNGDDEELPFLELLVKKGADINFMNDSGETAISMAAFQDNLPMTKFLLALGADVNLRKDEEYAPIHQAARSNAVNVLEFLIDLPECDKSVMVNGKNVAGIAKGASAKKSLDLLKLKGIK